MPGIADTIAQLSKLRGATAGTAQAGHTGRLEELTGFGSNPGALRGWTYLPERLSHPAPLVVVLHGCTQTAASYDAGSGWSRLADRYGFALLFPEQQRQNNPNLCFNWFSPADIRRGQGEASSIAQMIAAMMGQHDLDPARVLVTGLSAGGAMASVMLATYPEVFAGGAIIAGLPYGVAASVPEALERMRGQRMPGDDDLSGAVRGASPHDGPWPTISVWHGTADVTVNPSNADAIVSQWRSLHGVARQPSRSDMVDGISRLIWCDRAGRQVIEEYRIPGMGHGTPLATGGPNGCGTTGAFMLEAGISSTYQLCRSWGLATSDVVDERATGRELSALRSRSQQDDARSATAARLNSLPPEASGVGKVIEDALRAAGLMR